MVGIRRGLREVATGFVAVACAVALGSCGGGDDDSSAAQTKSKPGKAVLLAAGDIAGCNTDGDEATAALIRRRKGTVAMLGDGAYPDGTPADYKRCYDPSWGAFRDRTRPTIGNHDVTSPKAEGYYGYFGKAAAPPNGWYSFDLGAWHIVVLNSDCVIAGGCGAGTPQEKWLRDDLAANASGCTLAYWHHPRFSSGAVHGSYEPVGAFWEALYDNGADVVLNGHEHVYERFAPQTPQGEPDPSSGIRQFTVGVGGYFFYKFGRPLQNSEARNANTYGVLQLELGEDGYDWRFLAAAGGTFRDSGHNDCHD